MRLAALLLLAAALPAAAAEQWVRATSPNFDLWTNAGEKKAREALLRFEQVRGFFLKASPVQPQGEFPARVVAFQSTDEFRVYAYNDLVAAYYTSTLWRDYIVMQEPNNENYKVAIHEYFHSVVRHSGLRLPVWLNEGWADVYSTLRPVNGGIAVGDLIPYRVKALEGDNWMPLNELTTATTQSPVYNEKDRVGIFYAESWALVHMLYLSPEYKDKFGVFINAIHRDPNVEPAFLKAWGKTSAQVFGDLRNYLKRKRLSGVIFEAGLGKDIPEPAVAAASLYDSRLMMADLDQMLGRTAQAQDEFVKLGVEQPARSEAPLALGFLALDRKDREAALRHFEKAYGLGANDARMCMQLSILMRLAKKTPAEVIPVLERAVKARPDLSEAQIMLGLTRIDARDFRGGMAVLLSVPAITAERAAPVYCGLAFAALQSGDLTTAREHLETCRKYSRNDAEKTGAERLLAMLEARAKGPVPPRVGETLEQVKGVTQGIACTPSGNRLVLAVDGKAVAFNLPDPKAIEFTGNSPQTEMRCGRLNPMTVTVEFVRLSVVEQDVAGLVRRLIF